MSRYPALSQKSRFKFSRKLINLLFNEVKFFGAVKQMNVVG